MTDPTPLSLNGPWLIRPDPQNRGLAEGWHSKPWPDARTTTVPAAWQHTLGHDYHGVAWYARTITIPDSWPRHARLRLRFDAVATDATVFVSGTEVCRHSGDYLPFEFDISDAAAGARELTLVLRVDEVFAGRPPAGTITERGHITKGFHDVLSLQHGGIWGDVTLRATGPRCIPPNGIRITTDAPNRRLTLRAELTGEGSGENIAFSIRGPGGDCIAMGADTSLPASNIWERTIQIGARGEVTLWSPGSPDAERLNLSLAAQTRDQADQCESPAPVLEWTPDTPHLYDFILDLESGAKPSTVVESHTVRFGFRTAATGGPDNSLILLNNKPLLIRGVLHWGHEPDHIAPAPPPDQVRAEFARLKQLGFNCVCMCMWYAPPYYYDIADEMGMLIWQEHPVWKSPMEEELIPEYQRLYEGFFRRDRNHPSIILVSGSCEHERFHPDLAAWWWKRAKEELPDRLVQVQTAFIGWTNPDQTDLYDEHVYDSSGRWVRFCEDLQTTIAELPPKPFVMGETVIATSWLDTKAARAAVNAAPPPPPSVLSPQPAAPALPWWTPRGLAECEALELAIASRYGPALLEHFRANSHTFNLEQRKFQSEVLRMVPRCAGWVMNQIRDVPQGRLGFMDDLARWRFSPDQTLPWLSDQALLLRTPDHRRGHTTPRSLPIGLGLSNFGDEPFEGALQLRSAAHNHKADLETPPLRCAPGRIAFADLALPLPAVESPTVLNLRALAPGIHPNGWDLWLFPPAADIPAGTIRLDGLPFSRKDLEPEFEERAYSSGWGLKARTWSPIIPHPESVAFKAPLWRFDAPLPPGTRTIITHKLTRRLIDFMQGGGRVLLLANRTPGGLGAKYINLWGQVPLVIPQPPLAPADLPWVESLLHHDLTRRYTRAVPTIELGITDQVAPIVRLVFTHDGGVPRPMDAMFSARVGRGLLVTTSLDHTQDGSPAGRHLLHRTLEWLAANDATSPAALDPSLLLQWSLP